MNLDLLVSRIMAGYIRCPYRGSILQIRNPTPDVLYEANEKYYDTLILAEEEGQFTDDDIFSLLYDLDIWNDNKEKLFHDLPKEMEQFKVHIYENYLNKKSRETVRLYLKRAREKYDELTKDRYFFDHITCKGLANFAKWIYIIEQSTFENGKIVDWTNYNLSTVMNYYYESFLSETKIREIVKNEPWSSVWNSSKKNNSGVFCDKGIDLTFDQRRVIIWSSMYDNIAESSECPTDNIIMDDDALDGWLILKRKERETDTFKNQTEKKLSEKISKSDEIYLVASDIEEAREIEKLNDVHAANIKRSRINQLKKQGQVNEIDFVDSRQKIAIALTQKGRNQ